MTQDTGEITSDDPTWCKTCAGPCRDESPYPDDEGRAVLQENTYKQLEAACRILAAENERLREALVLAEEALRATPMQAFRDERSGRIRAQAIDAARAVLYGSEGRADG